MGRNVPEPGRSYLEAALAGGADRRRQETAFLLVIERETHPWRIEKRHVHEFHNGTASRPHFTGVIKIERVNGHFPVALAGCTGTVGSILQVKLILATKLQAFGHATAGHHGTGNHPTGRRQHAAGFVDGRQTQQGQRRLGLGGGLMPDHIGWCLEFSGALFQAHAHARAGDFGIRGGKSHIAFRCHFVFELAIDDAVSAERIAGPLKTGIALGDHLDFIDAAHLVRGDEGRGEGLVGCREGRRGGMRNNGGWRCLSRRQGLRQDGGWCSRLRLNARCWFDSNRLGWCRLERHPAKQRRIDPQERQILASKDSAAQTGQQQPTDRPYHLREPCQRHRRCHSCRFSAAWAPVKPMIEFLILTFDWNGSHGAY